MTYPMYQVPQPRAARGTWAVIDMVAALATVILALVNIVFNRRKDRLPYKGVTLAASSILGVLALVCLVLTQDITGTSTLASPMTPVFVVLAILALASTAALTRPKLE
jgi:hypothetical protein